MSAGFTFLIIALLFAIWGEVRDANGHPSWAQHVGTVLAGSLALLSAVVELLA